MFFVIYLVRMQSRGGGGGGAASQSCFDLPRVVDIRSLTWNKLMAAKDVVHGVSMVAKQLLKYSNVWWGGNTETEVVTKSEKSKRKVAEDIDKESKESEDSDEN